MIKLDLHKNTKQFNELTDFGPLNSPCDIYYKNHWINRFSNIKCRDDTRVGPFVHANFIGDNFIGSQLPKEGQEDYFWQMCIDNNVSVIVNLHETTPYLISTLYNISIKILENWQDKIIIRKLILTNNNIKHEVIHIHAKSWSDFGVPTHKDTVILFDRFLKYFKENKALVHCRAGIGRTGVFLAIYFAFYDLQALKKMYKDCPTEVNMFDIVSILRTQRLHLIQTLEQYKFCETFIEKFTKTMKFIKEVNSQKLKKYNVYNKRKFDQI
jgi:protein tyrosine phosphatase